MRRTASAARPAVFLQWLRMALCLAMLAWGSSLLTNSAFIAAVFGQEERNPTLEDVAPEPAPDAGEPSSGNGTTANRGANQRTLLDTIKAGGYIGVIIMLLSVIAVGFIVEHSLTIRKQRLMPEGFLEEVEDRIAQGDLPGAVQLCEEPRNHSLASEVVLAGIERFQASEFGFADYKSAVEEAGEDYTARLYRKTDVLSVIGAIAPMLGLFGTVEGMIGAFNTIADTGGAAKPDALAGDIGKALITTWLGLLVAIPAMIAFSFFRNKIDSIVSECGKCVERVLAPLSRRR